LGVQILPAPEEIRRISPLDRGRIMHEILCRFYQEALKKVPGPLRPENFETCWQIMNDVATRAFSAAEAQGLTGFPLLWELDREDLLEDLRSFLQKEAEESQEMVPTHFEIRFGYERGGARGDRSGEPISLALRDGTSLRFRGRIDRVDFSKKGDCLRVIDYKTGSLQGEEDGFCGGTTLQLPLYLMAACRIWKKAHVEKSWAEYYSVSRKGDFERLLFRGEGWNEKEKNLKQIMETIARGIEEGTFFPLQEGERDCKYCDFKGLCEHGVGVLFEKKRKDPRAAAFLRMREIP
jgi:ATP-dependent helicase/nuclease subunit B